MNQFNHIWIEKTGASITMVQPRDGHRFRKSRRFFSGCELPSRSLQCHPAEAIRQPDAPLPFPGIFDGSIQYQ